MEDVDMNKFKSPYVEVGMKAINIFGDSPGVLADRRRKVNNEYKRQWRAKQKEKQKVVEMLKENKAPYFNIGSGGQGII